MKEIWFDMDGTIADFYGVENWLDMLMKEDTTPYREAKPLIATELLVKVLVELIERGYSINIVSWTSKNSTRDFAERVERAKLEWLNRHLGTITFDNIDIIPYGTPKGEGRNGILFDDEKPNRKEWAKHGNNLAFDVDNIIKILENLI